VFHKTTPELQDQDQDRFFWSQTGLVLRPTVSDHITGKVYAVVTATNSIRRTFDGRPTALLRSRWRKYNPLAAITLTHFIYLIIGRSAVARAWRRLSNGRSAFESQSDWNRIVVASTPLSLTSAVLSNAQRPALAPTLSGNRLARGRPTKEVGSSGAATAGLIRWSWNELYFYTQILELILFQ